MLPMTGGMIGTLWWCGVVGGLVFHFFFFQAEDGIRDLIVTGVQTCALPISLASRTTAGASGFTASEYSSMCTASAECQGRDARGRAVGWSAAARAVRRCTRDARSGAPPVPDPGAWPTTRTGAWASKIVPSPTWPQPL